MASTTATTFERAVLRSLSLKLRDRIDETLAADIDVAMLGDPEEIADAMVAVLPGHVYDQLAGPFYDTAGLTRWLDVSRQALHQRVDRHSVLACPLADGGQVYPAWQFLPNGATLPGLAEVLAVLFTAEADPWLVALWLRAPSDQLGGSRPSDWLRDGGDPQAVLAGAHRVAATWAA